MAIDAKVELTELRVDGGASANDLLMQCQSDFTAVPIVRPRNVECTAYGAALLAGLGVGFFKDRQAIADSWQAEARFQPQRSPREVAELRIRWNQAVEKSRHWDQGTSD